MHVYMHLYAYKCKHKYVHFLEDFMLKVGMGGTFKTRTATYLPFSIFFSSGNHLNSSPSPLSFSSPSDYLQQHPVPFNCLEILTIFLFSFCQRLCLSFFSFMQIDFLSDFSTKKKKSIRYFKLFNRFRN